MGHAFILSDFLVKIHGLTCQVSTNLIVCDIKSTRHWNTKLHSSSIMSLLIVYIFETENY